MYSLVKKLLFSLDPETAHHFIKSLRLLSPNFLLKQFFEIKHSCLATQIGDTKLSNPIGLAAGFDKNAEMIPFMEALGFGFLEIGSITSKYVEGNPRPRIFRLYDDESIINRMGLPNDGAKEITHNLSKVKSKIPLGINIAKTPKESKSSKEGIDDYLETLNQVNKFGSYLAINLSCPNTGDGKTFEDPELFQDLVSEIYQLRKDKNILKPVLIKLSPDTHSENLKKIVETSLKLNFDGFIISNTSTDRKKLKTEKEKIDAIGRGGLSGKALLEKSNQTLSFVRNICGPDKMIMGVGGIMDFDSFLSKLRSGADLVQVYTGLIFNGPEFIKNLNIELIKYCQKRGYTHFSEIRSENSHG